MSRRRWRTDYIEQAPYPCHNAELHAHHGSSGVHIAQGPDTEHFALQPRAHTRRAAFEEMVQYELDCKKLASCTVASVFCSKPPVPAAGGKC